MSLTINAKTYAADSYAVDKVVYNGPNQTATVKDSTSLSRQRPKATSAFSGLSRTQAKLTRTLTLTGALTSVGDLILSIDVAVPVGAASADIDAALNDMGAFLASATFKSHVKTPQIAF